jgi:uncharacterized protein (TIGR00661 family)
MNIVYGVSGEGLGHVFEAIEIIRLLREDGHTVKVLTFGDRACRSLAAFAPTRIEGVHLFFNARGLSLATTLRKNYRCFPFYWRQTRRLLRELAEFQPEVFLTAYEPFTTFAAHRLGRPLISMDNQNGLCRLRRERGTDLLGFYLVRWATRVVTWGAAEYIVKSFERGEEGDPRIHVVAPMIQQGIRDLRPCNGSRVLVYLTKPNAAVIDLLQSIPEVFVVYGQQRTGEDRNIIYRAQGPDYLPDLASCKAIIGTTGFSLIADSIYLKKPYFGVPLKGQFEQEHNARFLARSGFGEFAEVLSREKIEAFLARLSEYRHRLAGYDLDPSEQEETLRRILAGFAARPSAVPLGGITALSPGA